MQHRKSRTMDTETEKKEASGIDSVRGAVLSILQLDLGPDPFVEVVNGDLGKELDKADLKGCRGFPGNDLDDDDRRRARDEPPGESLGEAPNVRVFPGGGHDDSVWRLRRRRGRRSGRCWIDESHRSIGRRRGVVIVRLEVVLLVLRGVAHGSSFSCLHRDGRMLLPSLLVFVVLFTDRLLSCRVVSCLVEAKRTK